MAAAAAAVSASGGGSEGMVPFPPLGLLSFGPATEPGPLDTTGRLPNELLESMFDFLDEDMTMSCASVARRLVAMPLRDGRRNGVARVCCGVWGGGERG